MCRCPLFAICTVFLPFTTGRPHNFVQGECEHCGQRQNDETEDPDFEEFQDDEEEEEEKEKQQAPLQVEELCPARMGMWSCFCARYAVFKLYFSRGITTCLCFTQGQRMST